MCFAYDLNLNEEYILFLNRYPGNEYYVQVDVALNIERLDDLKNVCDLDLKYPTGKICMLSRPRATMFFSKGSIHKRLQADF